MCYGSPDVFDNVADFSSYETLVQQFDRSETYDRLSDTLSLNPETVHSHGGHAHSHSHGAAPHSHPHSREESGTSVDRRPPADHAPEPITDGGSSTLSARSPTFDTSFDALVENARYVVDVSGGTGAWGRSGNVPGYDLSDGDRVLLVVDSTYDRTVVDAFKQAFDEEGASVVDTVDLHFPEKEIHTWYDECPGITYPDDPVDPAFEGFESALTPEERVARGYRLERRYLFLEGFDAAESDWWEVVAENYDLLVYGIGGPTPLDVVDRPYRYERIPWRNESSLASDAPAFPRDVWKLIDRKNAEIVTEATEVHLTDPEGTDLRWTNYVTGSYPRNRPCHVFAHPLFPSAETDTEGVIKGTTNHVNAFPPIEVEIEDAKVVDVSGGGIYGELWRETLEVAREYDGAYGEIWEETYDDREDDLGPDYDYYDGSPGFFWLWECAIGSNPKYARPRGVDLTKFEFPLIERLRAGVVHLGMGTIPWETLEQNAKARGLPWGHVHVHLLFPTLECTMPDGSTTTLIEDGYLTTLDDPEVRELAAQYGDPDEILSVDWVPDVPGVSSEGAYEEYADDPKAWLSRSDR